MSSIAIQLQSQNTRSDKLNDAIIGFVLLDADKGIYEASINDHQLRQIDDALKTLPHKIDRTGTGTSYVAVNGANW